MTRPILWALGTAAVLAGAGFMASERLAKLKPPPDGAAARVALPTPTGQAAGFQGDRTHVIPADGHGQFFAAVEVEGRAIKVLVDTGATYVALSAEDAARLGVRPFPSDFNRPLSTANGTVSAAPVRLAEIRLGPITVRDVEAIVLPAGALHQSLLGMSFLKRMRGLEVERDQLRLKG